MFRNALNIARQFTYPVVISRRTVGGQCTSGIGTFVAINDEGWFVTAAHIFTEIDRLQAEVAHVRAHLDAAEKIRADQNLDKRQRATKLSALGRLDANMTEHCSVWWGMDGVDAINVNVLPAVDLGVGRLTPFDATKVPAYAIFKDPAQGVEPGTSLCKLGYPFHAITPDWDAATKTFSFPNGALPLPSFPMEGMLTRFVQVPTAPAPAYVTLWMETSTPGLRGQSGGPTIDTQGVVWAIQANTAHLPLGFNPPVPGAKNGEKEHQFLNVGRGVHVETILGLLDSLGVKYDKSAY